MFKILLSLSILFLTDDLSISEISFKVIKVGSSDRRFIWLHGDEQTAKMALEEHMAKNQGIAYYIKNDETREVLLSGGLIDPNRIFSSLGAQKNIHKYNPKWAQSKKKALLYAIDRDRENFLKSLFPDSGEVIIALNNNYKGYNVKIEIPKSDSISIKKDQNPRDFYLCTNRRDFEILSKSPFNVVLQESYPRKDDGSLSWAAVKWGVRYVNIETRLGWLSMQKKMLSYANEHLPKK